MKILNSKKTESPHTHQLLIRHECSNGPRLSKPRRERQRSKLVANAEIPLHRKNSIDCWCTIGIPNSNLGVKIAKSNLYNWTRYAFGINLLHCRPTCSHVAICADQISRMFPRKSDRRSKIVRSVCVQHTHHWLLSTTIHILANQRQRRTIPMDQSPLIMTRTPQSRIKSTIVWPFLSHTCPGARKPNDARFRTNATIYTAAGVSLSVKRLICRMQ